jgi:hypothetical protein
MELEQSTINSIVIVLAVAYGAFMGYCLGRAKGYDEGSKMVLEIYRK